MQVKHAVNGLDTNEQYITRMKERKTKTRREKYVCIYKTKTR